MKAPTETCKKEEIELLQIELLQSDIDVYYTAEFLVYPQGKGRKIVPSADWVWSKTRPHVGQFTRVQSSTARPCKCRIV